MKLPEVLIIGGGIAGASLGHALAGKRAVTLLEREPHCAYHATGRTVTNFSESIGTYSVRQLTIASRAFLTAPPPDFSPNTLVFPRSMITIGRDEQIDMLADRLDRARSSLPNVHVIHPAEVERRIPILRPGYVAWAMIDPNVMDVDVPSLLSGYMDGLRQPNCRIVTNAGVIGIQRIGGQWEVETAAAGRFRCDILVNAAGAWADEVAVMARLSPLGLLARSRTVIRIDPPVEAGFGSWPMIDDASYAFYFKPHDGGLAISPSNVLPSPPIDARPEEFAVSAAITHFQRATTMTVDCVRHAWAGLSTCASDYTPVIGADETADGFVWLAAQWGCGIKAAPAIAQIAAAAVLGLPFPPHLAALGLTAAALAPQRRRIG